MADWGGIRGADDVAVGEYHTGLIESLFLAEPCDEYSRTRLGGPAGQQFVAQHQSVEDRLGPRKDGLLVGRDHSGLAEKFRLGGIEPFLKIPDDVPTDQAGQNGERSHQQQDQASAQAERERRRQRACRRPDCGFLDD